jgi:uncharacterized protein YjbI with pentapeptide repeats
LGAVIVLSAAGVAGWLLWRWVDALALVDPEKKAAAQLDVVKIAASVVVAGGGLFALYLAVRRQRTQELELEARHEELRHRQAELDQRDRVQAHTVQVAEDTRVHAVQVARNTELDASARRVTELYSTSVGQLGSDHAAVRLGGMYALARLADENSEHQQTVVNVLCAYLRMPYAALPREPAARRIGGLRAPLRPNRGRAATNSTASPAVGQALAQEREVRLTAQRLLATHLVSHYMSDGQLHPAKTFWHHIDLDLSGATLIDFTLNGCTVRTLLAENAKFIGTTSFAGTAFWGFAVFTEAVFAGAVHFDGTSFAGPAEFKKTRFSQSDRTGLSRDPKVAAVASFEKATFQGPVSFDYADFPGIARFRGTTFANTANFFETSFTTVAGFDECTFSAARFMRVNASGAYLSFKRAKFEGFGSFAEATLESVVDFEEARFMNVILFDRVAFGKDVRFSNALVETSVSPKYSRLIERAERLQSAPPSFGPPGWHLSDEQVTVDDLTWHRFERDEPNRRDQASPADPLG